MLRPAANISVSALADQRVYSAVCAQELDGPVRGGEAQPGLEQPGALVQLRNREAA